MADCFEDAEFWLPSQFHSDEDFLADRKSFTLGAYGGDGLPLGCAPWSGLSSPVDSPLGSLDAESDQEDLVTDLTRKMAGSNLEGGFKTTADSKAPLLPGSPQSTLCPGWDKLYEAAGEVARLRLSEQLYGLRRSRGGGEALHGAPGRRFPVLVPEKINSSGGGCNYSNYQHSPSYQQLVASQIQLLKELQQRRHWPGATWVLNKKSNSGQFQAVQNSRRKLDSANGRGTERPLVASAASALPPVEQQNRAGRRAVFLGVPPNGKRECAGTGVFLPRPAGSNPEPRKKPACSTVLLPDRVVRALNLNLENMDSQPHLQYRMNGCFASENVCAWNAGRNAVTTKQNRTGISQVAPPNHEVRLPHEWTY